MIVIIEGLDGVGKSTFIKEMIKVFFFLNLKTFVVSPLDFKPELKSVIKNEWYQKKEPLEFTKRILELHDQLMFDLSKIESAYDVVLLDRGFYSGFAYGFLTSASDGLKDLLSTITFLEKDYGCFGFYLDHLDEATRLQRLEQRNSLETKLFDSADEDTIKRIKENFDILCNSTNLERVKDIEKLKSQLTALTIYSSL